MTCGGFRVSVLDLPAVTEVAAILRVGCTTLHSPAARDRAPGGGEGPGVMRIGSQLRVPRAAHRRPDRWAPPSTSSSSSFPPPHLLASTTLTSALVRRRRLASVEQLRSELCSAARSPRLCGGQVPFRSTHLHHGATDPATRSSGPTVRAISRIEVSQERANAGGRRTRSS